MKVMVCDCTPYLRALEGLRKVLREIVVHGKTVATREKLEALVAEQRKIEIRGLEPVYDEDSLEYKIRYMGSGRRFIRHIRKFARLVGVKLHKLGWNLFMLEVSDNKILVGSLGQCKPIVVAFQGPVEEGFIGMMETNRSDFQNIEEILIEDMFPGDPFAAEDRKNLDTIRRLMNYTSEEKRFGFVCPDWAKPHWNQCECTIEDATDGTCVVLDHSIQTVVYVGHNRKECAGWLRG